MLRFLARMLLALGAVVAPLAAAQTPTLTAVEYYNTALDHYFVTADATEIEALDTGRLPGWTRTGYRFLVLPPTTPSGPSTSPVCRFYGNPGAGLNSHFYSAVPAECAAVAAKFPEWKFESGNVFQVYLADTATGTCPANTVAVYRTWNARHDSNHRYTIDASVQAQMIALGYVPEGYGDPPVVMCVPQSSEAPPVTGPAPSCTLTASAGVAFVGTNITLSALCNNAPTSYAWSGCSGAGTLCTATSDVPGRFTYSVTASNAAGSGSASTTVLWQPQNGGTTSFICTLSANATAAPVNSAVTLTASCSGATVARYIWTGCAAIGAVCTASSATPGRVSYSVVGVDANGVQSSTGTTSVTWQ